MPKFLIRLSVRAGKYSEWRNKRMGLISRQSSFAYFSIRCTYDLANKVT